MPSRSPITTFRLTLLASLQTEARKYQSCEAWCLFRMMGTV